MTARLLGKRLLVLLWTGLLVSLPGRGALAQQVTQPIDPLLHLREKAGGHEVRLGLHYEPGGDESSQFEQFTEYITIYTRFRYFFSDRFSAYVGMQPSFWSVDQESSVHEGERRETSYSDTELSGELGARYRFATDSPLDPYLSIGTSLPLDTAQLSLEGSFIRDPLVWSGTLGYKRSFDPPEDWLALGSGVGFIVNDKITLTASAFYDIPMGHVAVPQVGVTVGLVYSLDSEGKSGVSLVTSSVSRGSDTRQPMGVEWYRRSP